MPAGRRTRVLIIVWIAAMSIAALAASAVLSAYIRQTECPSYHYGDPSALGMNVRRERDNWSVTLVGSPRPLHPDTTSVEIRNASHAVLLDATPWTALTAAAWSTYGVIAQDNPPIGPLICEGDALVVSALAYPSGSVLAVLDRGSPLGWATLF